MGWAEMVVAIVAIVIGGGVLKARYDRQTPPADADADANRARDEIRNLKERIAVLERVITDNNQATNLDREIESLRDRDR